MFEFHKNTYWHVITGGPSSGKTKLMEALAFRGYPNRPEAARLLIDEKMSHGMTMDEIRADDNKFQLEILNLKLAAEHAADPNELMFWDRGMPDTIGYLTMINKDPSEAIKASLRRKYRQVFLLDKLPVYDIHDYGRPEDEALASQIHSAIEAGYTKLGYEVIHVPVLPISQRVEFVLDHVFTGDLAQESEGCGCGCSCGS